MPRVAATLPALLDDTQRVPTLLESRYSQSLERGLAILACFTPDQPVLGISDIADETGMSRSTTHRYVITLVALGYLKQGADRKYRLALRVTNLGLSALNATSLRQHARPYLTDLHRRTLYTISIAVLDGAEILFVDRLHSSRPGKKMILDLAPGSRLPLHCAAMGKVLLAYLPSDIQRTLIDEMTLAKRGPNTIISKRGLRQALKRVREDGIATNDEELAPGLLSIAVPVRCDSSEVRAALSIAAHTSTIALEELVEHLAPHLIATADRISTRLGYRRTGYQARNPRGPTLRESF
jgi:IclR family transcriptional regulator, pca regulon regulatory protein